MVRKKQEAACLLFDVIPILHPPVSFQVTGGAVDYPCTDCLEGKEINTGIQTYSTEAHSYLRVISSLCSPPDCGWKQAPMK